MARRIMDVMQENVDPASVSNALYELMVDWRSCVLMMEMVGTKSGERTYRSKRSWIEITLSRFFGVDNYEMRAMLEQHFGIKVPERKYTR